MKQKIVVRVHFKCNKCRSKALKIAASACGVTSVAIGGGDRDTVVVTGEGVDSAKLTDSLRKKFRCAIILSVQELKEDTKPPPSKPPKPSTSNDQTTPSPPTVQYYWPSNYYTYPPCPPYYPLYDAYPCTSSTCSLM
ncbi:heavy metal-associated isoprenylated plant protein 47-like [Malania oleifera]|uniref:heavy metal-associated isoprenylated plant protein 47-like n=1 Tax=Malania oleifera TaxID=397392 RepID=UPI0025AE01CD|nr:heavy metal-associated isoprenylated plant protein 47-like [Malania oleifera]